MRLIKLNTLKLSYGHFNFIHSNMCVELSHFGYNLTNDMEHHYRCLLNFCEISDHVLLTFL